MKTDPSRILGGLLRNRRLMLATAESCTGGLVATLITDIPGSSDYFAGGVVTYSNAAKQNLLNVSAAILARHGAVSRPVVRQMALNVCRLFDTAVGIAVSGIAGPGGGNPTRPVGLVFIAVALDHKVVSRRALFSGSRQAIREKAAAVALDLCCRTIASGD